MVGVAFICCTFVAKIKCYYYIPNTDLLLKWKQTYVSEAARFFGNIYERKRILLSDLEKM